MVATIRRLLHGGESCHGVNILALQDLAIIRTDIIIGNIFGASSIWFIMKMYTKMNVNLVTALAGGGAFLCVQAVLAVAFHSRPAALQWLGYLMIAAGLCLASMNATANLNK